MQQQHGCTGLIDCHFITAIPVLGPLFRVRQAAFVKAIDQAFLIIRNLCVNLAIELLEQAVINLLKNAQDAVTDTGNAQVNLSAHLGTKGHIIICL